MEVPNKKTSAVVSALMVVAALVGVGIAAPVLPGPVLRDVGLTAGGIRADVGRVAVVAAGLDFI